MIHTTKLDNGDSITTEPVAGRIKITVKRGFVVFAVTISQEQAQAIDFGLECAIQHNEIAADRIAASRQTA